jgi:hypothetical protein
MQVQLVLVLYLSNILPLEITVLIVSYASRVLTPVETRYSKIEREALAIVWSCHKFHLCLYGTQFSVITDHKPLERLFNEPQSKPPACIERWLLKIQPYRFNVQYQPGSDNPADFMSRHPLPSSPISHEERCAEEYVNFVSMHAVPKALTLEEIKEATKADTTLQAVIQAVQTKQWHNTKLQPRVDRKSVECFFHIQNELSVIKVSSYVVPV